MRADELEIPGVIRMTPQIHVDERGSFMEIFRERDLGTSFVQGNHSRSRAGVLRGLHYHRQQSDAWYVIDGTARVGLADMRERRGTVLTVDLSAEDPSVLYIPPGVAHGFAALTTMQLIYWVTHEYDNSDEFGVRWDDPELSVPWEITDPILSARDREAPALSWEEVDGVLTG